MLLKQIQSKLINNKLRENFCLVQYRKDTWSERVKADASWLHAGVQPASKKEVTQFKHLFDCGNLALHTLLDFFLNKPLQAMLCAVPFFDV